MQYCGKNLNIGMEKSNKCILIDDELYISIILRFIQNKDTYVLSPLTRQNY